MDIMDLIRQKINQKELFGIRINVCGVFSLFVES